MEVAGFLRQETYTASVTGNRALVLAVLASLALIAGYALRALTETNGSAESPPLASTSATVTASAFPSTRDGSSRGYIHRDGIPSDRPCHRDKRRSTA